MLKIRVINGSLKNSFIYLPDLLFIKPTRLIIKETIFSIIGFKISNFVCLDLFCGSGSLGIECLSIGVKYVTFVDNNYKVIKNLRSNLKRLGIINNKFLAIKLDAFSYLNNSNLLYDIIFLDPPYKYFLDLDKIIRLAFIRLNIGGYLYYECSNNKVLNINFYCKVYRIGFRGNIIFILFKKY